MSIKGFNVNGVTEQYDYNSLDNIPDIQGLPTGGTEGQVLAKTSGADYAVGWVNQTGGGGGGGSETDEIFWATRNVTTFAEVQEAVADGKLCAVKTGGSLSSDTYYLFYISDTRATFGNFSIINSRISALSLYSSNSWTYESLTIPEVLTFDTTPKQYSNNPVRSYGIWNAIQAAKTTVDATLSATSENPVQNRSVYEALATKADLSSVEPFVQDAVDEWMETYAPTIGTLSNAAKRALLNCFAHVAWIDDQGQTYYNALESELFPDATLESITAVFTQGSATIYSNDTLDTLRQYLTVTANYSDSTSVTISDYTLSGTLTVGTSSITVNYAEKTTAFNVTVTDYRQRWSYNIADFSKVNGTFGNNTAANCGIALLQDSASIAARRSYYCPIGETSTAVSTTNQTSASAQTSNYYPVPVPIGATKFTLSVVPNTQQLQALLRSLNNGVYSAYTAVGPTGYVTGSITRTFTASNDYLYLFITTRYSSSATNYPTEPTDIILNFE